MDTTRWRGLVTALLLSAAAAGGQERRMTPDEMVQQTLAATAPLPAPRAGRLPLYNWHLGDVGTADDAEARRRLRELDARGLAVVPAWRPDRLEDSLAAALRIARLQRELGLEIGVNANRCLYSFFNGDESTAHVDADGQPFFDPSFAEKRPMGCPFALEHRYAAIRGQIEPFLDAYADAELDIHFIFADWEIDGPIEWNGAWDASRRCTRCRERLPQIDNFLAFQRALRTIRSDMQRRCFAEPVLARFPNALVGNYGVYPGDGMRYWYDYFETLPEGAPYLADRGAKHRPWAPEFGPTGYTFGMPVVYTWYPTWSWYDFADGDYRWFHNLLTVGSNAGAHTPSDLPLITFVHWHTTAAPPEPDPGVRQFSAERYQELLWHLLLRGHDTLFLWSPQSEALDELRLLHPVYAESMRYSEFITGGTPLWFDLPAEPGTVVSGLRLGDRVLVRRTDFLDHPEPVVRQVGGATLTIPPRSGCQVLALEPVRATQG